jgi:hypothetical protein
MLPRHRASGPVCWPDSSRYNIEIGPPAGFRPAGGPLLRRFRLESGRNPARKTDFRPGTINASHRVGVLWPVFNIHFQRQGAGRPEPLRGSEAAAPPPAGSPPEYGGGSGGHPQGVARVIFESSKTEAMLHCFRVASAGPSECTRDHERVQAGFSASEDCGDHYKTITPTSY